MPSALCRLKEEGRDEGMGGMIGHLWDIVEAGTAGGCKKTCTNRPDQDEIGAVGAFSRGKSEAGGEWGNN
ncbi:hypothetical protein ACLE20_05270 [Rhizobium sp. YIM 134829]|uniref:hypothetical protein n=1 Tax=Rhizobium sp. YIM 134829 TaxID=3390453 RepID=UPI003979B86A